MNLSARFRAATAALMGRALVSPKNETPAFGSTGSSLRSNTTYQPLRNLREASPKERVDAVKTSRFLRARLGLVRALFENSTRYALGTGLSPSAETEDREWARAADDLFETIVTRPGFDTREEHDFYSMQPVICADFMCDGDLGAAKLRNEDDGDPMLQLFPSEAIGDGLQVGGTLARAEGWNEGILRNTKGKALAYRILKEQMRPRALVGTPPSGLKWWEYRASEFLHIGRFDRINLNRPMPWLHHGDGAATDILDLTALEKVAAKINSYFAAVIQTKTGEIPLGFESAMVHEPSTISTLDASGNATTVDRTRSYVQMEGGAAIPVLAEGESFSAFNTSRPSVTFAGFIDWLVNDIAWGFGVPPQFVWTLAGMTGPNARLVLQQADWFFRHISEVMIKRFCQPVWEGVIGDAIDRGTLALPSDGKWKAVAWQGPGSMTIDKGRDGKLYLSLVQNGMLSRSAWHEMAGRHGLRERRKIIDEIAADIAYCEQNNVPLDLYFGQGFGQQLGAMGAGQIDPEEVADAMIENLAGENVRLRSM